MMLKKSLLSLLIVSTFALAAEKPKTKLFTEAEVQTQIEQAKTEWQNAQKNLLKQRAHFLALEHLLNTANKQNRLSESLLARANQLVAMLNGYPLQMEAEALQIQTQFAMNEKLADAELAKFVEKYPNTSLAKRLAQLPFESLFTQQKWAELLEYSKKVSPESAQNQCRVMGASYQLLAEKMASNPEAEQAQGVKNPSAFLMNDLLSQFAIFWQKSTALPTECAGLEAYWKDNGGKTDEIVRVKAVNLYEKNAKEALQSLISDEDSEQNRWLKSVEALMNDPKNLDTFIQTASQITPQNAQTKSIALNAFPKWLKTLPEEMENPTFATVQSWVDKLALTEAEQREWKIAYLNRLFDNPNADFQQWRDAQIAELKADKLTERRLRMAIGQQAETASWLALLSDEGKNKLEWRYWAAKNEAKRKALFAEMAKERGFYPMLAAQQLGQNYKPKSENYSPLTEAQKRQFSPNFDRLQELISLQRYTQARLEVGEWLKTLSMEEKLAVIDEFLKRDWFDLAVEGTIQAKAFDYLNLRLPNAYSEWFELNLAGKTISKTFAQAIARQESAWNAQAKSHANAIGLMQMLPTTAEKTAKDNQLPFAGESDLLHPFNNVMLGTTHLAELEARYPNNRALISAAYNAGASRVEKWLAKANGQLAFDEFVASIPFYETRGYVQNVLAYDYYYQTLQNVASPIMFTKEEMERKY